MEYAFHPESDIAHVHTYQASALLDRHGFSRCVYRYIHFTWGKYLIFIRIHNRQLEFIPILGYVDAATPRAKQKDSALGINCGFNIIVGFARSWFTFPF